MAKRKSKKPKRRSLLSRLRKRKKSKPRKRKSTGKKSSRPRGRPAKSQRQKGSDLSARCKKRKVSTKNRFTGKELSEETLRHRCTNRNAPRFGGIGDPRVKRVEVKPRRKKRVGKPFKVAPPIPDSFFKKSKPSRSPRRSPRRTRTETLQLRTPQRELPQSVTIDRPLKFDIRREVQPTIVIRREPISTELLMSNIPEVIRFPPQTRASPREQVLEQFRRGVRSA